MTRHPPSLTCPDTLFPSTALLLSGLVEIRQVALCVVDEERPQARRRHRRLRRTETPFIPRDQVLDGCALEKPGQVGRAFAGGRIVAIAHDVGLADVEQ